MGNNFLPLPRNYRVDGLGKQVYPYPLPALLRRIEKREISPFKGW